MLYITSVWNDRTNICSGRSLNDASCTGCRMDRIKYWVVVHNGSPPIFTLLRLFIYWSIFFKQALRVHWIMVPFNRSASSLITRSLSTNNVVFITGKLNLINRFTSTKDGSLSIASWSSSPSCRFLISWRLNVLLVLVFFFSVNAHIIKLLW